MNNVHKMINQFSTINSTVSFAAYSKNFVKLFLEAQFLQLPLSTLLNAGCILQFIFRYWRRGELDLTAFQTDQFTSFLIDMLQTNSYTGTLLIQYFPFELIDRAYLELSSNLRSIYRTEHGCKKLHYFLEMNQRDELMNKIIELADLPAQQTEINAFLDNIIKRVESQMNGILTTINAKLTPPHVNLDEFNLETKYTRSINQLKALDTLQQQQVYSTLLKQEDATTISLMLNQFKKKSSLPNNTHLQGGSFAWKPTAATSATQTQAPTTSMPQTIDMPFPLKPPGHLIADTVPTLPSNVNQIYDPQNIIRKIKEKHQKGA